MARGEYLGTNIIYEATEPNIYGIYRVETQTGMNDNENLYITVYGIARYDSSVPEGESVSHTLYATLTDPFGYTSDPDGLTIEAANTRPQYVSGSFKEYFINGQTCNFRTCPQHTHNTYGSRDL